MITKETSDSTLFYQWIHEIPGLEHKPRNILGVDMGNSDIGLAIVDITLPIAPSPIQAIKGYRGIWMKELFKIYQQYNFIGMVVGLPLHENQTRSAICQSFRDRMVSWMEMHNLNLPILWQDEYESSKKVHQYINHYNPHDINHYMYYKAYKAKQKGGATIYNTHSLVATNLLIDWIKNL